MQKKSLVVLFFLIQIHIYAQSINYEGLWSASTNAAPSEMFNGELTEQILAISKAGDSYLVVIYDSSGVNLSHGFAVSGVDSEGDACLIVSGLYNIESSRLYLKKSPLVNTTYPDDWIDSLDMGDPEGDDWGPMGIYYRVGYSELHQVGTINDNNVRYRKFPTTDDKFKGKNNEVFGKYNEGQELELLWRSDSKMRIGNMNDYWYMVKDVNDIPVNMTGWPYRYGWVYGAFLDIKE